jgi:hypothetical protein
VVVLAVAVAVEIGLRTTSLPRLTRSLGIRLDLGSGEPTHGDPPVMPDWAGRSADRVDALLRHWPPGDTCLRRCLLLGHRLRGFGPVLRIGVRRGPGGELLAHSWLEIDGRSLDVEATGYGALGDPGGDHRTEAA